jgi:hypothetical protein
MDVNAATGKSPNEEVIMKFRIAMLLLLLLMSTSTVLASDGAPAGRKTLYLSTDRSVTIEMAAADRGGFDNFMAALQGNIALSRLNTTAQGKPPITLSKRGVPGVLAADLRKPAVLAEKKKPAETSLADIRDIVNRMATSVEDDVSMGRMRITGKDAAEILEMVLVGAPEARLLYAGNAGRPALDAYLATLADPLAPIRQAKP